MLWAKDCTKRQARAKHKSLSALWTWRCQYDTVKTPRGCLPTIASKTSSRICHQWLFLTIPPSWDSKDPPVNRGIWSVSWESNWPTLDGTDIRRCFLQKYAYFQTRRDKLINPANPICLQAKSQCLILKSPGLRKFTIFPLLPDFRYFGKISPTFPSPSPEPPWSQFRICEESKSRIRTRPVRLGSCETVVNVITVIWCGSTQE